jgi:chromosome segregation ATPase
MRATNATVKRMRDSIAQFDRDIDEARRKADRDTQAERQPLLDRLKEIEETIVAAGKEMIKCRASAEDAEETRRANRDKLTSLNDDINRADEAVTNHRRRIAHLEGARTNSILSFGDTMQAVMRAIQAETGWQRRPVGPIGQHVKLGAEFKNYAGVLESFFSDTLNAFLVDNERDKQLLNRILRQHRPK